MWTIMQYDVTPIGVGADPYGPGSLYKWCCTRDVAE